MNYEPFRKDRYRGIVYCDFHTKTITGTEYMRISPYKRQVIDLLMYCGNSLPLDEVIDCLEMESEQVVRTLMELRSENKIGVDGRDIVFLTNEYLTHVEHFYMPGA